MAADRGPYICQSMSLNIHMRDATTSKLTALHFHAWKRGLETGMYYLRNTPSAQAVQFTVDKTRVDEPVKDQQAAVRDTVSVSAQKSGDDPNVCIARGS